MSLKKEKYDVIVVGAGPAGTTAARELAKGEREVLLIDKKDFPRDKNCGGLIPAKALAELEFSIPEEYIQQRIQNVTLYSSLMKKSTYSSEELLGVTIPRSEFDYFLLNKAIGQGVRFYQNTTFQHLEMVQGEIKVYTNHGEYWCKKLIGADGVFSKVKRYIQEPSKVDLYKLGFTVSTTVGNENKDLIADFNLFGVSIPFSMGWAIPFKDKVNLGIGGPLLQRKKILGEFKTFYDRIGELYGFNEGEPKIRGGFLPAGGFKRKIVKDHILLIGDAAGLADPYTGEGIYYAIKSGKIAARGILQESMDRVAEQYETLFHSPMKRSLFENIIGYRKKYTNIDLLREKTCARFGKRM